MPKDTATPQPTGLALLRQPFEKHQISKLPKPTKDQTDQVRNDFRSGIRCDLCGGWHHPNVVHLDYVGHAALTDRLLDCDPEWNWEPVAFDATGNPARDASGGMWIKLTVCGVTRYGYGDAEGKKGGNAVKEMIGDALRNAAMRFGAALDLWHKGDLHVDDAQDSDNPEDAQKDNGKHLEETAARAVEYLREADDLSELKSRWAKIPQHVQRMPAVVTAKDERKTELEAPAPDPAPITDDEIPY